MSRSMMRKTLKFFHTAAACGLVGALLGYAVLLAYAPQQTAHQYADMRQTVDVLCNIVLLPSLAVALISGLLSMAVHTPFQEMRWVWIKALLGLGMFESTLAVIQSKAHTAAKISANIAAGEAPSGALDAALSTEWSSLAAILALSAANIALGVWRPALQRRSRATIAQTDDAPESV
ncbi:MAG: DUF2269 family protein [Hyphomicrobium sp.]|nr:DUF2269 family protein [Hyphomicrobium sp.]